jgi:hypothetical protein
MKKTSTNSGKPFRAPSNDHRFAKLLRDLCADSRLVPIVREFENRARTAAGKFGSNGLKVNGKLFALFTQGTLVVKLPHQRVAALVEQGIGKPFDPGHGRLMKGWLTVVSPQAPWLDLAREALLFVSEAAK